MPRNGATCRWSWTPGLRSNPSPWRPRSSWTWPVRSWRSAKASGQRDFGREILRFEDAPDGEPYLGVGRRGSGGQTDPYRPVGEPAFFLDLLARVEWGAGGLVPDHAPVYAIAARDVVAPRDPLLGDDRQVVRIRGVVSSDRDHHVQRMLQQLEERILPVLRRRADGVEELEVLFEAVRPVTLDHRLA